jgi:hypothetical protein
MVAAARRRLTHRNGLPDTARVGAETDEKAGQVLDRSGHALRRAEGVLQDTKEHISQAFRAGQEAIRPAPRTSEA